MTRYAAATRTRISQRQHADLRPTPTGWRFFPPGSLSPSGPSFTTLLSALQWSELADRRRIMKAKDAPLMPLLNTRTGLPGEIELAGVRTIVYTAGIGSRNDAEYIARRARIARMMTAYGMRDWRFHYGKTPAELSEIDPANYHGTLAYCAAHCADHARFCRENSPPLLVMEDDAEPAWPCSHFVPPPGADRLHIGGDTHGVDLARKLAWRKHPNWRRHGGYLWRPYNRDWFEEAAMLAYHAVLYLTQHAMDTVAAYLPRKSGAVDAVVSELDGRLTVYAAGRCWWWQNDGHNGAWSYDFAPPALRDPRQPKSPP